MFQKILKINNLIDKNYITKSFFEILKIKNIILNIQFVNSLKLHYSIFEILIKLYLLFLTKKFKIENYIIDKNKKLTKTLTLTQNLFNSNNLFLFNFKKIEIKPLKKQLYINFPINQKIKKNLHAIT